MRHYFIPTKSGTSSLEPPYQRLRVPSLGYAVRAYFKLRRLHERYSRLSLGWRERP